MNSMISKFIEPGNKIEIQMVDQQTNQSQGATKTYISQIQDILSENQMEIVMPMEQTKLILLPVDREYNLVIYAGNSLFQCFARVIDRYKSQNVYILLVELTSNLRKYQRREYYRFSCALEMNSRNLEEEEIKAIEERDPHSNLIPGLPLKRSVIVDISGGGLRFLSSHPYEPGSMIYISYNLFAGGSTKEYELVGKVLSSKKLEDRKGSYEHRVQYVDIDADVREEIIKYIFEEERKHRKKERLGES
ncbi:MAG: flagellar brake protein [bacterium]|nr:flagellar brake protein [bacterium]MCM1375624.1 flagellar brake protein [Muribaculum sp.]